MITDLQALIDQYLHAAKHRSLKSLTSKAGVSYSTVRRIVQNEVKGIDLANALAILKVVAPLPDTLSFLQKHFPDAGEYFQAVAKASSRAGDWTLNLREELERALYDFDSFVIISLASTPDGTTHEQIAAAIGPNALDKVALLIDSDVLEAVGDKLRTKQRDFAPTSNGVILAEIGHCARFIRDNNIGKQRQHCALRTNGVTREGQRQLHACLQKALVEAERIIDENLGDIPVFYGTLMGLFTAGSDEHA